MLDFRVETFLAVCRHMNFTKAARELNITQPAVLHHELVCSATLRSTQILNISAHRKWGKSGAVVTN